jgi:hypothetical protein
VAAMVVGQSIRAEEKRGGRGGAVESCSRRGQGRGLVGAGVVGL